MNEEKKNKAGEIAIFSNDEFGQMRTTTNEQGEVLLCLVDVCVALDLKANQVVRRLSDDVVSKHPITDAMGRTQQANFINEDGFYDVVLESRKPNAKKFRKWVTSEVLPAIRKTGAYAKNGEVVSLRQMMGALSEYMRGQQLVNQMMLETLQAMREDITAKRQAYVKAMPEARGYGKPMFVVEVSIVPAGVRCVTDFLASQSLGYTLQYPLNGSLQVLVVDGPVEASLVEDLKSVIRGFTRAPKWAKIKTIQI